MTRSLLGSYLAGRVARGQNDTEAAAGYYRQALVLDPGNDVLIEQSFLMELIEGNWPRAEELARELVKAQPTHRTAQAFMGLIEFKAQRYAAADEHFKAANANPIGELTSTLALRLAVPGAGQDPGGAGRPRLAQAAGLGAVLSALSPGAARRSGRAHAPRRAPPTSASPRTTSARCASRSPTRVTPVMSGIRSWR